MLRTFKIFHAASSFIVCCYNQTKCEKTFQGVYLLLTQNSLTPNKTVLVCQNRTCKASGSVKVLQAFQKCDSFPDAEIVGSSCLGQCGNGPMVLVLPEETWYSGVAPHEVKTLIEQHLHRGQPVKSMLYSAKHNLKKRK